MQGNVALISLIELSACVTASPSAQQPQKVHRIGFLVVESPEPAGQFLTPILDALAESGYIVGQNLVVETRFADGQEARLDPRLGQRAQTEASGDVFG